MIPFFISHTLQMKQLQRVVRRRLLLVVLPRRRRVQTGRRRRTRLPRRSLLPPRSLILCKMKLHHLKRLWTRRQQQLQIIVNHLVSLLPMRLKSARQQIGVKWAFVKQPPTPRRRQRVMRRRRRRLELMTFGKFWFVLFLIKTYLEVYRYMFL